jgi:hypothetical protein
MSVDLIVSSTKERASALAKSPALLEASEALLTIPATLTITSDADDAAWGDVALRVKKGERHVESGLTECFREVKAFEKAFREHMRTAFSLPLAAGVKRIDDASKAWRNEKARAAAEAQRKAEEAAREAARIAAEEAEARRVAEEAALAEGRPVSAVEAAEVDEFDVAPGVAQTIAPPVERIARGEEAATFERRTLMCSLEDEGEAFKFWGRSAFVFDERAALAALKSDTSDLPAPGDGVEGSVVIGGVRYWNEVSIQRRAR